MSDGAFVSRYDMNVALQGGANMANRGLAAFRVQGRDLDGHIGPGPIEEFAGRGRSFAELGRGAQAFVVEGAPVPSGVNSDDPKGISGPFLLQ
jgi:hypothetical protein